jgi:hypothetical protein
MGHTGYGIRTATSGGLHDRQRQPGAHRPGHRRAGPRLLGDPRSWEKLVERYEGEGYCVLAPAYPGLEVEVEALREDPSPIEALTIPAIVEHYEGIIGGLDFLELPPCSAAAFRGIWLLRRL